MSRAILIPKKQSNQADPARNSIPPMNGYFGL